MFSSNNKINPNFSLSSMADIIFLLLIFFMISSNFIKINALNLSLPKSKMGDNKMAHIRISIDNNNNLFLENKPISLSELENQIIVKKYSQKNVSIALHVDKTVEIQHIVQIMDLAKKHDLSLIMATASE